MQPPQQQPQQGSQPGASVLTPRDSPRDLSLSPQKLRWVDAEFSHKIEFGQGTKQEFVKAIVGANSDRYATVATTRLFKMLSPNGKVPRKVENRASDLFQLVMDAA